MKQTLPLLHNTHTHPSIFAAMKTGVDISNAQTKAEALAAMDAHTGDFILVLGWHSTRYTFEPTELDHLAPALVCNVSLHEFILNTPARTHFADAHPGVVKNIDDTDWVERNLYQILKFIAANAGVTADGIKAFYRGLAEEGVWGADDMLLPGRQVIALYEAAGCLSRTRLWADPDSFSALDPEDRAKVFGIKVFMDGAVGARTAALNKPYDTGTAGLLLKTDRELYRDLAQALEWNKPVAIHNIGDRATAQVISSLTALKENTGKLPPMVRLEHCQYITPDMAETAKSLGAVLSMQPNFSEDSIQYKERLPGGYAERNNPFRMLIDQAGFVPGKDLFFGTDGPPHGVEAAVTACLFPPLDSQRLTLEECIAGYCLPDMEKGRIEIEIDHALRGVTARVVLH
ncbi:MAG: amidohydrolase family protein [Desulfobacter sp.]|nr:MAG: amidohydrolase family protein [Desulfobacter sp.]